MTTYDHIEGLSGREPVGAVLRIGKKGPKGNPIDNDRFYICQTQMGDDGRRPEHPSFKPFNKAQSVSIRANIVHATVADAWNHHRRAQVLGPAWKQWPKAHPNMRPICEGDGVKATRLYGIGEDGVEDWQEIDCPNNLCEFSERCPPMSRLYFRPRFPNHPELPLPLMKWASKSWNSSANVKGFFEYVDAQAHQIGLADYSLFGLPFILELAKKKQASKGRSFPVVSMSPDCDLIEFFVGQRARLEAAGGSVPQLVGATSEEEGVPIIDVDAVDLEPGTVGVPGDQSDLFTKETA